MKWLKTSSGRSSQFLLIGAAVIVIASAALQLPGVLGARQATVKLRAELAESRLLAALGDDLEDGARVIQDDTGMSGGPLAPGVLDKLKERYTVPADEPTDEPKPVGDAKDEAGKKSGDEAKPKGDSDEAKQESSASGDADSETKNVKATDVSESSSDEDAPGKKPLSLATVTQIRTTAGVDERTAAFIYQNRSVRSWEDLAQRKRQLFDENADAIEPLIVARISRMAAESGIQKIDQLKVEPPRETRRTRAAQTAGKPAAANGKKDSESSSAFAQSIRALKAAAAKDDEAAVSSALEDLLKAAEGDTVALRALRAALEKEQDESGVSPTRRVQIRLATLRTQPQAAHVTSSLLRAHVQRVLATFPKEGDDPVVFEESPFPPLVSIPMAAQRRILEQIGKEPITWITDEALGKLTDDKPTPAEEKTPDKSGAPESANGGGTPVAKGGTDGDGAAASAQEKGPDNDKKGSDREPAPAPATTLGTHAAAARDYATALIDTAWNVFTLVQKNAKATDADLYKATLLFKCPLEQLVTFTYKIENDTRWFRVAGMRITVEQPDQPLLSVSLNVEASVLLPNVQTGASR